MTSINGSIEYKRLMTEIGFFFFHCINSIDFLEKLNGDKC